MKNSFGYLTLGQVADIHQLNKRTLHYYDEIGLFSPAYKGENGYRYYSFEQSMELEHILTLRELGMSIGEIKAYLTHPAPEAFQAIAHKKIREIQQSIARLKSLKQVLEEKSGDLARCKDIRHGTLELVEQPERYLLLTPLPICFDTHESLMNETSTILEHLRQAWSLSSYRKNCGSFLSLEKVRSKSFQVYDGVFSTVDKKGKNLYTRPKGRYLRGYSLGDWDKVQDVYEAMLDYADAQGLRLSGYAFEYGLNEFAITSEEEYITQIEIFAE